MYIIYLYVFKKVSKFKLYIIIVLLLIIYTIFYTLYITHYTPLDSQLYIEVESNLKSNEEYLSFNTHINKDKYRIVYYCKEEEDCNNINYGNVYNSNDFKLSKIDNQYNNPSSFNSVKYYGSKQIFYEITINNSEFYSSNHSLNSRLNNYRRHLSIRNKNRFPNSYQIINALILGYNEFDEDITDNINNTGVNHLFVISGSHLIVIIYIINTVLGYLQLKNKTFLITNIVSLITYSILAGFSYPVIRATFVYITTLLNSRISTLQANLLIFLILITLNPLCIFNLSFFLSFYITFIMVPVKSFVKKLNKSKLASNIIFSYLIYLSIIPIIINLNYSINILAPIAGIVIGVVISFILIPCCFFLTFSTFSIGINFIVYLTYTLVLFLLQQFSFYSITTKHINIYIQFILIILLLVYLYTNNKKYITYYLIILFVILLNINILGNVSIIDIGQGDSALIQYPLNGEVVLIDTGPPKAEEELENYLNYRGIKKINKIIITHDHLDHNGNLEFLINNYKIDQIYTSTRDESTDSIILQKGDSINLDNENIEILSPSTIKEDQNLNSISFIVTLGNKKWFFGGDIEQENEELIAEEIPKTDVDFLKVSHHGSNTSSTEKFINQFTPEYAIISCGKNNMYNHPNVETMDLLSTHNIKTFVTKDSGAYIDYFIGNYYFGGL